jgi:hypothetical protein
MMPYAPYRMYDMERIKSPAEIRCADEQAGRLASSVSSLFRVGRSGVYRAHDHLPRTLRADGRGVPACGRERVGSVARGGADFGEDFARVVLDGVGPKEPVLPSCGFDSRQ